MSIQISDLLLYNMIVVFINNRMVVLYYQVFQFHSMPQQFRYYIKKGCGWIRKNSQANQTCSYLMSRCIHFNDLSLIYFLLSNKFLDRNLTLLLTSLLPPTFKIHVSWELTKFSNFYLTESKNFSYSSTIFFRHEQSI